MRTDLVRAVTSPEGKEIKMTNYEIRENPDFNSREVYFDGKPSEAVRAALKNLKMRWHSVKKCWYGFAKECELIAAILGDGESDEPATVSTAGYLGGGAVYGSKSQKHLYGAELSAAIRADIKKAGIKGAFVKCKEYSGGQSITVTLKLHASAYLTLDEYIKIHKIPGSVNWIYFEDESGEHSIYYTDYFNSTNEEQEAIRISNAILTYKTEAEGSCTLNQYHIDKYKTLKPETIELIIKVNNIICAYRYDESNSQVDYFSTNFYYDICITPAESVTK